MKTVITKTQKRERRHKRIRAKVAGTAKRPRLSIYKSNRYIHAQLINDEKGVTLAAATTKGQKGTKTLAAQKLGEEIAALAKEGNIKAVVFDRGGFRFAGRVAAVALGARKGGLQF